MNNKKDVLAQTDIKSGIKLTRNNNLSDEIPLSTASELHLSFLTLKTDKDYKPSGAIGQLGNKAPKNNNFDHYLNSDVQSSEDHSIHQHMSYKMELDIA